MSRIHGGGPAGKVPVTDISTPVQENDQLRSYLEIQNSSTGNRCHLRFSDDEGATWDAGLYLDPGDVYTMTTDNLTYARVSAVCDSGQTTDLYYQVGR